jgi:hypothetical protein
MITRTDIKAQPEIIVSCQYNGRLFSYIAGTHFQMRQAENPPPH